MKLISLTHGLFAKVDDADFDWLNQWKWQSVCLRGIWYAKRGQWNANKRNNDTVMMHAAISGKRGTDHINGDGLDNQRHNLRDATKSQNGMNASIRADNQSGVPGVYWDSARRKWHSQIGFQQKIIALGRFEDKQKAIEARKQAEEKYFGGFSLTRSRGIPATIDS